MPRGVMGTTQRGEGPDTETPTEKEKSRYRVPRPDSGSPLY
jgi:hypothetical protein